MSFRLISCALLLGAFGTFGVAHAQRAPAPTQRSSAAPQLTPQQKAALEKQNQVLAQYAEQIANQIDHGQYTQVWDQASDVARRSVTRDQFAKATQADRTQLGTVTSRKLEQITRALSDGKEKLPAGYYVNVNFATQFSKYAKPVRELVSFHLDSDKKWRLSGYTVH